MTVFDTDVLVEILVGNPRYVDRAAAVLPDQQGISVVTGATLVSRNRRDFELIPGLLVEFWE